MNNLSYPRRAFQIPVGSSLDGSIALLLRGTLDSRALRVGFSNTPCSFSAAIQRQVRTQAQQCWGAGGGRKQAQGPQSGAGTRCWCMCALCKCVHGCVYSMGLLEEFTRRGLLLPQDQ